MIKHFIWSLVICAIFVNTSCKDDDMMGSPDNGPITLDCRIDASQTLTNHNLDGVDYIADCEVEVFGGNLKIEAGTTIQFNSGASMVVEIDGSITAIGTASEPVRMQGAGTAPSWGYLFVRTDDPKNQLDYVQIAHAGKQSAGVFNNEKSAVYIEGRLGITNCTISDSDGHGITILEELTNTLITDFTSNIFRDCAGYPVVLGINSLAEMNLASCTFSNNGNDLIRITAENGSDRLNIATTLQKTAIPYYFESFFELYDDLTVEAGVDIVFNSGAGIEAVASPDAFLKINGNTTEHVVFRGQNPTAGAWAGLFITSTNSNNEFNYLDISDGGGGDLTFANQEGNINLEGAGAKLTINDCTSTRAQDCDVVISTFLGQPELINNSPSITDVCEE